MNTPVKRTTLQHWVKNVSRAAVLLKTDNDFFQSKRTDYTKSPSLQNVYKMSVAYGNILQINLYTVYI